MQSWCKPQPPVAGTVGATSISVGTGSADFPSSAMLMLLILPPQEILCQEIHRRAIKHYLSGRHLPTNPYLQVQCSEPVAGHNAPENTEQRARADLASALKHALWGVPVMPEALNAMKQVAPGISEETDTSSILNTYAVVAREYSFFADAILNTATAWAIGDEESGSDVGEGRSAAEPDSRSDAEEEINRANGTESGGNRLTSKEAHRTKGRVPYRRAALGHHWTVQGQWQLMGFDAALLQYTGRHALKIGSRIRTLLLADPTLVSIAPLMPNVPLTGFL